MPKKRELVRDTEIEVVLVDTTECEIERPKKQRKYYSGKKRKHMIKAQIVADEKDLRILNISFSHGSVHDFKLFCKSCVHFLKDILLIANKGYIGMNKIHSNSLIPEKSTKRNKLIKEDRKYNSTISKRRIYIEHVNRYIKKFRIVSTRYRKKRRKFALRFSLICAIYNFEL